MRGKLLISSSPWRHGAPPVPSGKRHFGRFSAVNLPDSRAPQKRASSHIAAQRLRAGGDNAEGGAAGSWIAIFGAVTPLRGILAAAWEDKFGSGIRLEGVPD